MPLTVLSPYSGRPVKVRDQDVGRAVRDKEGRVFYVVDRANPEAQHEGDEPAPEVPVAHADDPTGGTHYASLTRHGSAKDRDRYDALVAKGVVLSEHVAETAPARGAPGAHDATGRKRSPWPRLVVLLVIVALIGVGVKLGWEALAERELLPDPPWSDLELPEPGLPDGLPDLVPGEPVVPDLDPPEGSPDLPLGWEDAQPEPSPFEDEAAMASSEAPRAFPVSAVVPDVPGTSGFSDVPHSSLDASHFDFVQTASGLRYRVDRRAEGPRARARDYAVVRYSAYHAQTGLEVDATPAGAPLGFVLWAGQVFRGLDEGVAGMAVGEKRTLLVPAHLTTVAGGGPALDDAGSAVAGAALRVEVELLRVLPGVSKRVLRAGDGRFAGPGDRVRVHWSVYLGNKGTGDDEPVIDSRRFGGPMPVTLGAGAVIPGLELGIVGMAEGERAELRIPPYLAYGAEGAAGALIPPHATLRCEVELLAVEP